jgi:hypothetical protein
MGYQPVPQHNFSPGTPQANAAPPPAPPPAHRRRAGLGGLIGSIFGDGTPDRDPQTTVQQFGSEGIASEGTYAHPSHQLGDTVDAITSRVAAFSFSRDKQLIMALENGQTWIQIPNGEPVRITQPPSFYTARIMRSDVGSYLVKLTGIRSVVLMRRMK